MIKKKKNHKTYSSKVYRKLNYIESVINVKKLRKLFFPSVPRKWQEIWKLFVERKISNLLHVTFAYRASETHNQWEQTSDMALRQYRFYSLRIKDNKYRKIYSLVKLLEENGNGKLKKKLSLISVFSVFTIECLTSKVNRFLKSNSSSSIFFFFYFLYVITKVEKRKQEFKLIKKSVRNFEF